MASLSINGTTITVSGLTRGIRYAFRIYPNTPEGSTSFRVPASGTTIAEGTSWNYNLNNNFAFTTVGTYRFYVSVWDGTNNITTETGTVTKTVTASGGTTKTHYARCGEGVSSFKAGSTTITATSSQSFSYGYDSMNIGTVSLKSGYGKPYKLWYNIESSPTIWDYDYKTFTSSTSIDTTFTRRITVSATPQTTYYKYSVSVYLDGSLQGTTPYNTNTASSVIVSNLAYYTNYINKGYEFDYFKVNSSSTEYTSPSSKVNLNSSSTTYIYLYFKTKAQAVAPTVSLVSSGVDYITISWDKNGGSGYWRVFYRLQGSASTEYTLFNVYVGTTATITGLTANKTYSIYVQNFVNSSDLKNSNILTASTQGYKAVKPTISSVTPYANSATVKYNRNGGTSGDWYVFRSTDGTNYTSLGSISNETKFRLTGLTPNTTYYIYIVNTISEADYKKSDVFTFKTYEAVSAFSWTSNDATNIKAGAEFSSFITAIGWNNLIAKINLLRQRLGEEALTFQQAKSGEVLTADNFNAVADAVFDLAQVNRTYTVNKGDTCLAKYFANDATFSLKEKINIAINAINY